jgi:hypothetical protein
MVRPARRVQLHAGMKAKLLDRTARRAKGARDVGHLQFVREGDMS